ncbi:MAG: recombination mediator RecR [Candidatus Dojkabacteria bacterium]|jgi:recombination protein RecR|nr:recombination mediator RecR [Candidatus Dojkabacteria bacterium]MDD2270099.1 recombination mediator RecR [Candidatus Dojkabacteria bacterium]
MSVLPQSVEKVINEFSKLPGVGPKTAARMTYHYLRSLNHDAKELAEALTDMDLNVSFCKKCFNVSEKKICDICSNPLRKNSKLCVVEEPLDVIAFENSAIYDGFYFVLGGVISPSEGIGAEDLRFNDLKKRVNELLVELKGKKLEIIVATNPNLEGEASASYICDIFAKELKEGTMIISRLAMGLPTGADLEYADRLTLKRALEGRRSI